jgi:hypothetical protein
MNFLNWSLYVLATVSDNDSGAIIIVQFQQPFKGSRWVEGTICIFPKKLFPPSGVKDEWISEISYKTA